MKNKTKKQLKQITATCSYKHIPEGGDSIPQHPNFIQLFTNDPPHGETTV